MELIGASMAPANIKINKNNNTNEWNLLVHQWHLQIFKLNNNNNENEWN